MFFLPIKQILINPFLVRNIVILIILYQFNNTSFKSFRVIRNATIFIIINAPIKPGHQFFAEIRESCFYPIYNCLEIQSQFIAVCIMLMPRHIIFNFDAVAVGNPLDSGFKVILPNGTAA